MPAISDNAERLRVKTRVFTALVVVSNVAGNSAFHAWHEATGRSWQLAARDDRFVISSVGGSRRRTADSLDPHPHGAALVLGGLVGYVLPVTAIGYVLTSLSGKYLLGETISPERWAGILLITSGVTLVGLTRPATTPEQVPQ